MTETTTTPAPIAHTTRRNLLIAAPAVAAVIAFPAVAAASTSAHIDRAAWETALSAHQQITAEDAAFSARYRPIWDECSAACKRIPHVAAADKRDVAIRSIRDSFGMDALDEQSETFGDRLAEAEEVLMETPAPDLAALRWKLDHLMEPDSEHSVPAWSRDYVRQTVADYQRLCGGA